MNSRSTRASRRVARGGFTLIELMIVVAIIGTLAGIAAPSYTRARAQARSKACHTNQQRISGALEVYQLDTNEKVRSLDDAAWTALKAKGYLAAIPVDPGQGPDSYKNYEISPDGLMVLCKVHGASDGKTHAVSAAPTQR